MGKRIDFRNRLHFSAPAGWINDPNGFSHYKGVYHLFYQHNPHDTVWGPMHWGHAVSTDLIRWKHLPVALTPGEPYDRDGCFSGSAVVDGDRHMLMYTGHRSGVAGMPEETRQVQCLAVGDGRSYRKLAANPVIGEALVPPGSSPADFRDPKLWREGERWFCLIASRSRRLGGELLLYTSLDLEDWSFVGIAAHGGGASGSMWECPDFFALGKDEVLIWSPEAVPKRGCEYRNKYSSVYSVGSLNRKTGEFQGGSRELLDYGPDFYAPQTLRSPDARRILIAWMQMWERTIPTDELRHGWAGSMTIPREVETVNGFLLQRPVRELETYRAEPRHIEERLEGERGFPQLRGHVLDLEVSFAIVDAREVGLAFKCGGEEKTLLTYSVGEELLMLDRSRSGLEIRSATAEPCECVRYCCPVTPIGDRLRLRIILDRTSCEVFADGGRKVISATLYPAQTSDGISFFARSGSAVLRCTAWDLRIPS